MDWHERYVRQAAWTRDLRAYLFERAGLAHAGRVLEAGCGTGAVLQELVTPAAIHGLDLDGTALRTCRLHVPSAHLVRGDGLSLPYAPGSFDIVYCHFLLLWVQDPVQAARQMKRAARSGGYVLALAEPDYSSRMDKPASLEQLGHWQAESLRQQGADPSFGARLADTFSRAGIQLLETGRLQNRPKGAFSRSEWESEWQVLESDLADMLPARRLEELKQADLAAWLSGERTLDVPTYFACGRA
jgi:ubiquinone/menaquinone biosynthesis C-methylase UbiE